MVDDKAEETTTDLDDTGKLPVVSANAGASEASPDDSEPTQTADSTTIEDATADEGVTTDADAAANEDDTTDVDAAANEDDTTGADAVTDAKTEEDTAAQAAGNADAEVAEGADEGEQTSEFREIPKVAMRGRKSPLPLIGIAVAILLAVGGLVAAILLLPGYGGRGADDASAQSAQDGRSSRAMARTDVTIPLMAPGLDEKGSRVPLRATGTDVDGNKFSEVQYVSHDGVGVTLPLGSYEVHVAESPISAQGIMYDLPLEGIKVSVYAGGNVSFEPKHATLELTPTHPESINDGKIEAARKMILADPQKKDLASKLAKLVVERRKKAVAFLADKRKEMRSREDEHEDDEEKEDEDKDKEDESDSKDSGNGSKANNSGSKSQSKESGNGDKDDSGSKDEGGSDSGGGESNAPDSHSDNGGGGEQQQSGGADAGGGESGDTGGDAGGDTGGGASEPAPQPEPSTGGDTGGGQPAEG